MTTKTIGLELDAYEKLRRAKVSGRESFSSVVRRGRWARNRPVTAGELVSRLEQLAKEHPKMLLPDTTLNAMARRRRTVRRKSKWDG
jgi:hypothetical protein